MNRRRTVLTTSLAAAAVCILAAPTAFAAEPGDMYVTESLGGSVLEFSDFGDLSAADRFATGLSEPIGICRGPEQHLYVAEFGSNEITIIDDGGDFTNAPAFANGLAGMQSLWCDDERILVTAFLSGDPLLGGVLDVTAGGAILEIPIDQLRYANAPSVATSFVSDGTTEYLIGFDAIDVSGGGDFMMSTPHTTGLALVPSMVHSDMFLAGQFQGGGIYDIEPGGDLSMATPWATLPDSGLNGVEALLDTGTNAYALINNSIYDITAGGDLTAATPVATGVNAGLNGEEAVAGTQQMLQLNCLTDDDCTDADACNGVELCLNNACAPPSGPTECDDDDVCTADSCDPDEGCSNEPIDNCCEDDFDCAIDEVCDSQNQCVATDPTGGDPSAGGSDSDSGSGGSDSDSGAGSDSASGSGSDSGTDSGDTEGEPGADDGGSSSGCTSGSDRGGPISLILLLAAVGLRTRRRS